MGKDEERRKEICVFKCPPTTALPHPVFPQLPLLLPSSPPIPPWAFWASHPPLSPCVSEPKTTPTPRLHPPLLSLAIIIPPPPSVSLSLFVFSIIFLILIRLSGLRLFLFYLLSFQVLGRGVLMDSRPLSLSSFCPFI